MKISNKPKYKPIDPKTISLVDKHGKNPEALLEILMEIQEEKGYLEKEKIHDVARALKIPSRQAYGVATFYSMLALSSRPKNILRVCDGPVCWMYAAEKTHQAAETLASDNPDWNLEKTSCLGLCDRAPAVLVNDQQAGPITPEKVQDLPTGFRGEFIDYGKSRPGELRVMLAKAGLITPESLESALKSGAYCGLKESIKRHPEEVLGEVESSGLTGRGGAGFPVGRKWRFVAQAERTPKYIICNADESEPLIYKDRVLIDTNPHQILEGMAIAGFACSADEAFIYIRGEYESQARRLEEAIHQAELANLLGDRIQGSDFSFHIHVHRGAGAYICGEETALIESLEGKRGEPRLRPPYPPNAGYRGLPTLVNNVESFAAVPTILCNGGLWYRSLSTYSTPGTKLYMLLGFVNHPGIFEAPFGLTLRKVIDDFGGGMKTGSKFQFALTGGAAGTIVPPSLMDVPIDYGSAAKGVSLGAGAFLICDQKVSIVAFLRELLHFFAFESCGKCTPCRVGTYQSHRILTRLSNGQGLPGDLQDLKALAENMLDSSFCGLGQSVPTPMISALRYFESEFIAAESQ